MKLESRTVSTPSAAEFGLRWNDTVPLTTGAHNAFLSAFVANFI